MAYRIYVTDALRLLTENTARFAGGSYFKERYFDQIRQKEKKPGENRSGQEIADDLIGKLTKKAASA